MDALKLQVVVQILICMQRHNLGTCSTITFKLLIMKKLKFLFAAVLLTCVVGINQANAQAEHIEIDDLLLNGHITSDYVHIVQVPGNDNFVIRAKWTIPEDSPLYVLVPENGNVQVSVSWVWAGVFVVDTKATLKPTGELLVIWHNNGAGSVTPPQND